MNDRNGTVLDRFDGSVQSGGHRPALVSADGVVSYDDLDGKSNRIAGLIRSMGVSPGSLVAVSMERSPAVVAAILGVLKAGCAYVPLDPANPDSRLRLILDDAKPAALLTEAALAPRFEGATANLVGLDGEGVLDEMSADAVDRSLSPSDLAYVIYTSGTTGVPKGVMVTHGNLSALLSATEPLFAFDSSDVWTLFHSYGFDVSVWEMWGALAYGGRLVIPSATTVRSPDAFYDLLHREEVTVLCQTPSAFSSILDLEDRGEGRELNLRYVIFAGEELDPRRFASWFGRHGDEVPQIVNMYGITETTIHSTYRIITRADADSEVRSPIGRALSHLRITLLDESGQPAPDGVPGEIHVSGDGVTAGYLNRPDLTAERFLSLDGTRAYRSGDLACRLADGGLDYRGRIDAQVQVRGFRVELGEIETVLREQPGVADAVVAHRTDRPGGRLVAYVVPRPGESFGPAQEPALRQGLADRLPSYMLPSDFVVLTTIPLTANGKVDRSALPEPGLQDGGDAFGVDGPDPMTGSDTLSRMARIWAAFLSVDRMTPETDFFEVGGHSLLAVEVMIRAREEFGVELPLGTMFEHTTLRAVAERIDELTEGTEEFVL